VFATGLGGPISVSNSSIRKAEIILENFNNGSNLFYLSVKKLPTFRKHVTYISYNYLLHY
jgi:BRCA2 repeat